MAGVVGRRWGGEKGWVGGCLGGVLRLDRHAGFGLGFVWLVGGLVRVLAAGRGVVGDSVCGAGASMCGGRLIVACGVFSSYAALSNVPVRCALRAVYWGRAYEGGVGLSRWDAPWLL